MITKRNKKPINNALVKTLLKHRLLPVFLFAVGMSVALWGVAHSYFMERVFQPSILISQEAARTLSGIPQRIRVAYFFDLDVEKGEIVKGVWNVSPNVATYLTRSARLGSNGNVIMYGHNRKRIFANLKKVKVGNIVLVTDEQGIVWRYGVVKTTAVKPADVSWLQETKEPVLTVYTCTGFMDSQRLIVRARLLGIE